MLKMVGRGKVMETFIHHAEELGCHAVKQGESS